jgi:putative ABC transport system permease protein
MPDGRDVVARLIPEPSRSDAFLPARQDLRVRLCQPVAGEARFARVWRRVRYGVAVIRIVAQCWALAMIPVPRVNRRSFGESAMGFVTALRHAVRSLRHQPAFTIVAALTLGLGVGANVAVFAVVEATLLRPMGFTTDDRLIVLRHFDQRTGLTKPNIAMGDFIDIRAQAPAFAHLAAYVNGEATVFGPDEPVRTDVLMAGVGLTDALGVRALHGRLLGEGDARQGAAPVAVMGHAMWASVFGADPAVVGRRIRVGGGEREIVGITPQGFRFPPTTTRDTGLIVPLPVPPAAPANRRAGWPLVAGLLAPGVGVEDAAAQVTSLAEQFERQFPADNQGTRYHVLPLRDALMGDTKRPLLLLLGAVGVVLLIACANVGNLLMTRALGRRSETAVRVALGASRGRLLTQQFAESLVLVGAGAAVGLLAARWGMPLLVALVPESVSTPGLAEVGLNPRVLWFAAAVSLLSIGIFSVISALTTRAHRSGSGLLTPGRVTSTAGARRAASALVMVEIALAVTLVVGAGLILRSFGNLAAVDPGFNTRGVLTLNVALPPGTAYATPEARSQFYQQARSALRALPGLTHAGEATVTPLTGNNWTIPFQRVDVPVPQGQRPPDVGWQVASGGYFEALGIPLLDGRFFSERDAPGAPAVVIISQSVALEHFGANRAVGRRVQVGDEQAEIVGVVGDIRRASLTDTPRADMYLPFERSPGSGTTMFLKTSGDPLALASTVRDTLRRLDRQLTVTSVSTLERTAAASMAPTTFAMWLMGLFAALALSLAAIGVYGVMAYAVRQRTRELGTRVALGATRRDLVWLIVRQGLVTTAIGLGAGLGGAWLAGRALGTLLHGVPAFDVPTVTGAVAIITMTSLLACYIPARRASRVDAARTLTGA